MTRANLLDERRAGAEIADDEDRQFGRITPVARRGEELRREDLPHLAVLRAKSGGVVADTRGQLRAAQQLVALRRRRERLVITPGIIEDLGHRNAGRGAVLAVALGIFEEPAEPIELGRVGDLLAACRQRAMRRAELRVDRECFLVGADRLRKPREPDFVAAYYSLAGSLTNQERVAEALPYYERAVAFDADFAAGWVGLGSALRALGRRQRLDRVAVAPLRRENLAQHQHSLGMVRHSLEELSALAFGRRQPTRDAVPPGAVEIVPRLSCGPARRRLPSSQPRAACSSDWSSSFGRRLF
jgi:tetratricopeptide (TPR) repeat protein